MGFAVATAGGDSMVLLRVRDEVSVSSGMVENFLSTCLRAGRRMGLLVRGE